MAAAIYLRAVLQKKRYRALPTGRRGGVQSRGAEVPVTVWVSAAAEQRPNGGHGAPLSRQLFSRCGRWRGRCTPRCRPRNNAVQRRAARAGRQPLHRIRVGAPGQPAGYARGVSGSGGGQKPVVDPCASALYRHGRKEDYDTSGNQQDAVTPSALFEALLCLPGRRSGGYHGAHNGGTLTRAHAAKPVQEVGYECGNRAI